MKKLLAFLLSAAVICGLAGCGTGFGGVNDNPPMSVAVADDRI